MTERVSLSEAAREGGEEARREVDARGAEVEKTEASDRAGVEAMEAEDEQPRMTVTGAAETTEGEELAEERTGERTETTDFDAEVCLVRGVDCFGVRREVVRAALAAVACMYRGSGFLNGLSDGSKCGTIVVGRAGMMLAWVMVQVGV